MWFCLVKNVIAGRSARFKVEIIVTAGKMYQCREVVFSHVRYVHLGAESTVTFL